MKLYSKLIVVGLFLLSSCNSDEHLKQGIDKEPVKIAISKAKGSNSYLRYGKWLKKLDSNIVYFDMYHISIDSALTLLQDCDGLLLSGGPDVNPARYKQIEDTTLCETIDYKRDSLEYALIEMALENKMPILGICRGEQILNVYLGGSLHPDIPTAKPDNVGHRYSNIDSSMHKIEVEKSSLLYKISKQEEGMVNSSHHQAVNQLAPSLIALAHTADSIVESLSWKNPSGKSFLLGLQWHPEWMQTNEPFSTSIGKRFIQEATVFQNTK